MTRKISSIALSIEQRFIRWITGHNAIHRLNNRCLFLTCLCACARYTVGLSISFLAKKSRPGVDRRLDVIARRRHLRRYYNSPDLQLSFIQPRSRVLSYPYQGYVFCIVGYRFTIHFLPVCQCKKDINVCFQASLMCLAIKNATEKFFLDTFQW